MDFNKILMLINYSCVFIVEKDRSKYMNFYFDNEDSILNNSEFESIVPKRRNLFNEHDKSFIKECANKIKDFLLNEKKKVIFIEQGLLYRLVGETGIVNIISLLLKNKKQVVLFCFDDVDDFKLIKAKKLLLTEDEVWLYSGVDNVISEISIIFEAINNDFNTHYELNRN